MGRQQFELLKGVVRRALLRRFHNTPVSPHRTKSDVEVVLWSKVSGLPHSRNCNVLNSKSLSQNPSSRRIHDSYFLSDDASTVGCLLSPELHSRVSSSVAPTLNPFDNSSRYFLTSQVSSPALQLPKGLAKRLSRSMQGGSRGLSSLVENSSIVDEVTTGGGREGQGGDEGVSASVSGRENLVTKRRKRKSVPTELDSAGGGNEGVATDQTVCSELKEESLDKASCTDNVLPKPRATRKKRSKISGEKILQAFNENVKSPGPVHMESGAGVSKSPSPTPVAALEASSEQPLQNSLLPPPKLAETAPAVSSPANVRVNGDARKKVKEPLDLPKEGTISAGFDGPIAVGTSAPNEPEVRFTSGSSKLTGEVAERKANASNVCNEEEIHGGFHSPIAFRKIVPNEQEVRSISASAGGTEQVEEILRKRTVNSPAVEVPAVNAIVNAAKETIKRSYPENGMEAAAADSNGNKQANGSSSGVPVADPMDFSDSQKLYRTLSSSRGGRIYQANEKAKLNSIFYRFAGSGWVSDQALSLYINSKVFPTAASKFRKFVMHKSSQELRSFLVSNAPTATQLLFPLFAEFCLHEFPSEISRYRELVNTADMTKPDAWYPFARAIKRKVVYHKGPTNSGKTYNALKRYREASSGIYCSPLRLLAMEIFDTVNTQGVYCNLHTGQEKKDVPFANHLSCTVEMCYLTQQWEVAVIDEIQMMGDEYRGWAWTRAFLGLQADEVHVCGDPSALPLIRNLCSGTGDELVEYEYERFKPLKVAEESLRGDFRNIQAGDCIVAFSRRDIFDIKREVELATKHRCCVVYGALPPETRTQQAKLFNEVDNGYDVLVASDAIGMGLNLNIRRVVFFSLHKFDGDSKKPVPPAQVKQIAGRAGRRGSLYPEGVTTTFFSQDLDYLKASMVQDFEPAAAAGLFPVYEQVELFASQLPNENFAKLLERFAETCRLDGSFFLCRYDNLKRVANVLEKVKGLSLEDRFNFCFAPVNVRDPQSMGALYRYATAFSQKIPVHVEMGVPSNSARDEFELLDLEARHQVLSMYLWLSQHFPGELFPQKEQAGEMASQIAVLLGQSLVQSSRRWTKRKLLGPRQGRPFPRVGRPDLMEGTSFKNPKFKSQEILVAA